MDFWNIFFDSLVTWILTGSGIFAVFKAVLWLQGLRIVSYIRIYYHRKQFFNHVVFANANNLLKYNHPVNNIQDLCKKEIAKDLLYLEVLRIKQVLKNNLKFIFKKNLIDFIKNFSWFKSENLVYLFLKEYEESKNIFTELLRKRVTQNNYMSQEDFNRFLNVYNEFIAIYEIIIYESIHAYVERRNVYGVLWNILDEFNMLLELMSKTLAHQINIMNGRLYKISYKGYTIGEKNE